MKYTLLKIKDEYYLVTDEEPEDRYPCMTFHKETKEPSIGQYYQDDATHYVFKPKKIIASTIQIHFLVESKFLDKKYIEILLGAPNVHELAKEFLVPKMKESSQAPGLLVGFVEGYNKCAKDNIEKKFTIEDIENAINFGMNIGTPINAEDFNQRDNLISSYIDSFEKQKTEWDVEIETEDICKSGCTNLVLNGEKSVCCGDKITHPKLTEGYITITKIN